MACSSFDCGILNIRIGEHIAPETGSLMGIVDLHNSELLHKLVIDLEFLLFELGNNLLSEVDRNDVNQHPQVLQFLLRLKTYIKWTLTFSIVLSMPDASFSFLNMVLIVFLP
jgi:hypothetical protein